MSHAADHFIPVNIAVLTVSDTRTEQTDSSGRYLAESLTTMGHCLADKRIVPDDIYLLRAVVSNWIADATVNVVLITGGTGLTGRDVTPQAMRPLFDREIEGFGELFRYLSIQDIGTSTVQSRALAGMANSTLIFCLPGSSGACRTAWEGIFQQQLDSRFKPCNFINLLPRYSER